MKKMLILSCLILASKALVAGGEVNSQPSIDSRDSSLNSSDQALGTPKDASLKVSSDKTKRVISLIKAAGYAGVSYMLISRIFKSLADGCSSKKYTAKFDSNLGESIVERSKSTIERLADSAYAGISVLLPGVLAIASVKEAFNHGMEVFYPDTGQENQNSASVESDSEDGFTSKI